MKLRIIGRKFEGNQKFEFYLIQKRIFGLWFTLNYSDLIRHGADNLKYPTDGSREVIRDLGTAENAVDLIKIYQSSIKSQTHKLLTEVITERKI